jgi:type II secretory pathway pseudopilin PulG
MDRLQDRGQPAKRTIRTRGATSATSDRGGTGGFTLVELIVAFSISLIVIGATTAMLLAGTNMARHTTQRALEEQIVDGAFEFAENRIRFATVVEGKTTQDLSSLQSGTGGLLYIGDPDGNPPGLPADEGVLFFRTTNAAGKAPTNVLGTDYYMDHTISLDAKITKAPDAKPVIYLKITLYDRNGIKVAERAQTHTLINGAKAATSASKEEVTISSSSSSTNPALLYFETSQPSPGA